MEDTRTEAERAYDATRLSPLTTAESPKLTELKTWIDGHFDAEPAVTSARWALDDELDERHGQELGTDYECGRAGLYIPDASGRAISANLERDMRAHGAWVSVERVALEPEQIEYYKLPTRPGKATDSRHARFAQRYGDASVELDALPPNILEKYVRMMIEHNIDRAAWQRTKQIEALERETLASIAAMPLKAGTTYALNPSEA